MIQNRKQGVRCDFGNGGHNGIIIWDNCHRYARLITQELRTPIDPGARFFWTKQLANCVPHREECHTLNSFLQKIVMDFVLSQRCAENRHMEKDNLITRLLYMWLSSNIPNVLPVVRDLCAPLVNINIWHIKILFVQIIEHLRFWLARPSWSSSLLHKCTCWDSHVFVIMISMKTSWLWTRLNSDSKLALFSFITIYVSLWECTDCFHNIRKQSIYVDYDWSKLFVCMIVLE